MADLTNEIAAIQVATTGSEIRSAIVDALNSLNSLTPSWYLGSYIILPSISSQVVSVSGYTMASDLTIETFPVYSGSYNITPISSSINLNVSNHIMVSDLMIEAIPVYSGPYTIVPSTSSQTFNVNGLLMTDNISVDAFSEAVLISKTVTSNGVYNASDDNADGFSVFTVSLPFYSGSYIIEPRSVSQTFSVSGMVMSSDLIIQSYSGLIGSLISKTVTSNGIYNASDYNADGFSVFTVSLPFYSGSYIIEPSTVPLDFDLTNLVMSSILTIESYPLPLLISMSIYSNGIYSAYYEGLASGFSEVTVSVPIISDYWQGTQSEYDALSSYASNVAYFIINEVEV